MDQEAQDKAIEVDFLLPHALPTFSETAELAEAAMKKFIAPPPQDADAKAAGLVFSATFEIWPYLSRLTDQVEGALVVSIADYIRVNTKKISMKARLMPTVKSPRNYFGDVVTGCLCQEGAGNLPVDFKIRGKTRSAVRKYSVMIKKCIDNSTCPFVQTFEKDIVKLGFTLETWCSH